MRIAIVELDTGEQEFFNSARDALNYARSMEHQRKYSVEYVAVTDSDSQEPSIVVYNNQMLRMMMRSVDNVTGWLKSGTQAKDTL